MAKAICEFYVKEYRQVEIEIEVDDKGDFDFFDAESKMLKELNEKDRNNYVEETAEICVGERCYCY